MSHLLFIYGSTHGQTEKIVNRMTARLREQGAEVTVHPADRVPEGLDPAEYDAVLVAAPVYFGRHVRSAEGFARRHAALLARVPSAFLSVCGAIAGDWADGPREAAKYRADFLARTGWVPDVAWTVAGAVEYRKYAWPMRMVMKFISWRTGRPTDTSRDWEFTDWDQVDRIAHEMLELVEAVHALT